MLQSYPQWHSHVCVSAHKCSYPKWAAYYSDRRHLTQHRHRRLRAACHDLRRWRAADNDRAVDCLIDGLIEVIVTFIEVCEMVVVVVVVVFWLTATMLATMLGAYVSCTGRKHGFVYWVLRCLGMCVCCMCCYVTITYFNGIVVVTFGNLCFIIKDTYMKHKWNERISKDRKVKHLRITRVKGKAGIYGISVLAGLFVDIVRSVNRTNIC